MIVQLFNYKVQALLIFITTLFFPTTMQTNVVEEVNRDLEEWNLGLLAMVQNTESAKLLPFTTDGCSGGLSEGWNSFASLFPAFRNKFGENPPWESCCVDHDRAYWKGEVEDGFNKRLTADKALRQCVIDYGNLNSEQLSKRFAIAKEDIQQQFKLAAELMYRAVRVGGKPCSMLPWRWGYGWPHCSIIPYPEKSAN